MCEEERTDGRDEIADLLTDLRNNVDHGFGDGALKDLMRERLEQLRTAVTVMKGDLSRVLTAHSKAEQETETMCKAAGSAVINMRTALAVLHLRQYAPDVLKLDRIPF